MPKSYPISLAVILLSASTSGSSAAANPLFESDAPLALILEFPLRDLLKQKKEKATVPGVLRYTDVDGSTIVLEAQVSTRGNSRLEQCRYPPLRINLKKKQVASTLFAGQDKLKLVTLCRDTSSYRRYLSQEYLVYKIYNLLSDFSFRARMLEVTFREPSGRQPKDALPAFFIESDKAVAERNGMTPVKSDVVNVSQLHIEQLTSLTLFQFMVGNTDWSVRKGPAGESCCHNGKVIGPPDSGNGWVVLPYDFDQSGLINTNYAIPSDALPIKSVRQRLYRGFCSGNAYLDSTIAMFNDQRSAIEDLFDHEPQGSPRNKSALNYLQGFFAITNDPKKRQKQIVDKCQRTRN